MTRNDLVLALLAAAGQQDYSPAQLQKSAFLVSTNLPGIINEGPGFDFQPYDYGPFDKAVYSAVGLLQLAGDAVIEPSPWGRWATYAASKQGVERGQTILAALPEASRNYIQNVSKWARAQTFTSLVKSIYEQYPEMRKNSIFRDTA